MSKFRTDYERLEYVKKYKTSGMSISAFAKTVGVDRSTLRDRISAYDNLDGSFVKLNKIIESPDSSTILSNEDVKLKILTSEQIAKKSRHFTRIDHSIVVIKILKLIETSPTFHQ